MNCDTAPLSFVNVIPKTFASLGSSAEWVSGIGTCTMVAVMFPEPSTSPLRTVPGNSIDPSGVLNETVSTAPAMVAASADESVTDVSLDMISISPEVWAAAMASSYVA